MIDIKVGDKVHYSPQRGKKENGIAKLVYKRIVFVVYHCNDDWDNYGNYTSQSTEIDDLQLGWIDEKNQTITI